MPTKYFSSGSNSSKLRPFFKDWFEELSPEVQQFLQGWKIVVTDFRFNSNKKNGWFLDTVKFTTFMFKSHPFHKELTNPNFVNEYRGIVFCIEIDSSENYGYKFCLEDEVIADWEIDNEESLGVIAKGSVDFERKIIFQADPSTVPSLLPNLNGKGKGKVKSIPTASAAERGQEGTREG